MKKITFLCFLFIFSAGFAQMDTIENFDGTAPSLAPDNGECTAIGLNISTAQSVSSPNSLEIIAQAAGNPWQGAQVIPQGISGMELTTNKNMTVDVYSTVPAGILAKVTGGTGPDSATSANHTGGGWETLAFSFTTGQDGTVPANGVYPTIRFYPLWGTAGGYAGQGSTPCVSNAPITIYIDNIMGTLPSGATCSDGIQNQGETGVDCGGPCAACPPPSAAPLPTAPDVDTFSIYNGNLPGDVTSYTANWPYAYQFGTTPVELDLDPGTDVNGAWRFNFGSGGYGQGEGPVDASTYDVVSFDYYAAPATAGTAGFRFVMINSGAEYNYEIGPGGTDQEPIVLEQWTRVEIPMSYFTGLGFNASAFFQWKFDPYMQSVDNKIYVFVDNILLTRNNALSVDSFDTAEFKVFPNPTNGNWNISSSDVIITVKVYDILGKQVSSMTPNSNDVNIDAANFKSGIYFAKIEGETGSKTVKLIRQ